MASGNYIVTKETAYSRTSTPGTWQQVKNSGGRLLWLNVHNTGGLVAFVNLFTTTSDNVTLATTFPDISLGMPIGQTHTFSFGPNGIYFTPGLGFHFSTGTTTNVAASGVATAFYI